MPESYSMPDDAVATVPLIFKDQFGRKVPPPGGGTVSSSDASVAVALAADGGSVTLTPTGDATATIAYSNAALNDDLALSVTSPVASSVAFDPADASLAAKP